MLESQTSSPPSTQSIIRFALPFQSNHLISTNDVTIHLQSTPTTEAANDVDDIDTTDESLYWNNQLSGNSGSCNIDRAQVENGSSLDQYLKTYMKEEVLERRMQIAKGLKTVTKPIRRILSMVEDQEPRFKGTYYGPPSEPIKRDLDDVVFDYFRLKGELDGDGGEIGFDRLSNNGIKIISSHEFEFLLYLSHSGTFTMYEYNNSIDHHHHHRHHHHHHHQTDHWYHQSGQVYPHYSPLLQHGMYGIPGTAALKLSDGRKRSMSLWVEFITASGFLSAKKMRLKFRQLVIQALDKLTEKEKKVIRMEGQGDRDGREGVVLVVKETYKVELTLSFRCENSWPRSASPPHQFTFPWQREMKSRGFDLVSKKVIDPNGSDKPFIHPPHHQFSSETVQMSNEDDVWQISFDRTLSLLLYQNVSPGKKCCLEILKSLMENHCLHIEDRPVDDSLLENLALYEFEKHPVEEEWSEARLGERLIGILLQLITCLKSRSCLLYFTRRVDFLRSKTRRSLDLASIETWKLLRQFVFMNKNIDRRQH